MSSISDGIGGVNDRSWPFALKVNAGPDVRCGEAKPTLMLRCERRAAVTADEFSAENFRAGLNQFDELTRNDKAIFHSKMQLLASGLYQVLVMYESSMLPDEELYSKSESLFLPLVLSPGGNQWWEAYKHLPPKTFKAHVDKRLSDENLNITPANEDLDWYKID